MAGFAVALACMCCATPLPAQTEQGDVAQRSQVDAVQRLAPTGDQPDWHIRLFAEVVHKEHPGFARWFCALGDVNGDGYDDFAVSSAFDTTFVFFGGDPLDPEPVLILPGGRTGIASGDFNGDGRIDIATAIEWNNTTVDPEGRGHVRLFFHKTSPPFFGPAPDMILQGDSGTYRGGEAFAGDQRSAIQTLDFNGDGYIDILLKALDYSVPGNIELALLYGGPLLDNETDLEFTAIERGVISHHFAEDILTGDLNGDGFDDILVYGTYGKESGGTRYWDYFPGNDQGWTHHTRTLHADSGWSPRHQVSNIMDVNHDGYDDIIDGGVHKEYGDAILFLGMNPLPERIMPNDSIPNLRPELGGDRRPGIACPVGDMNGDGVRDLLIGWATYFIPDGTLYYLYPVTPWGLHKEPLGVFGTIPDEDWVDPGAYDAGDVNGDGYDDIIVLGRGFDAAGCADCVFQIYLGDPHMKTAIEETPAATSFRVEVYPNPVHITDGTFNVRLAKQAHTSISITLHNTLGQVVQERTVHLAHPEETVRLSIDNLLPGIYFLTVRQERHIKRQIVVLF
jgi:hypothetical protein